MIVRELLTLLGFTVDKASYDKAAKQYDAMQGNMVKGAQATSAAAQQAAKSTNMLGQALGMLQRFGAQVGLSGLLKQYVTLASSANETRSALGQLFGEQGAAQVDTWAETMAATMGRSKYDLQQYAAGLGAVLGPVTESREEAQKMAQSLSELAVDLGSFFDTSDEQAMHALRSGLTGEMESLKKYGIVINDVALKEEAERQGIKKKITQMTTAEKTQLRYAAILSASSAAQGDAARTAKSMANATKGLQAQLKTLGIDAAKRVMPVLEKLVGFARDAVGWFGKMAKQSHLLESAMYTLAGVAGVLALEFYGAFVLPALAVAALVLLVDELWTTLEGGDTVIRDIVDGLFGDGTTAAMVERIKAGVAAIRKEFEGLDARGVWDTFAAGVDNARFAVERLIEKLIGLLKWTPPGLVWQGAKAVGRATGLLGQDDATERAGRGINAPVMSLSEELAARQADQRRNILGDVAGRAERAREQQYGPSQWSMVPSATESAVGAGVLAAPGGGGASVVNMGGTTININGGDPEKIRRVVVETHEAERKKTMAAIGGRGRS